MPNPIDRAAADIAVVEAFFEALRVQDLPRAFDLMADDIVYQNFPLPADHGKPAVMRTMKAFGWFVQGFDVQMRNIAAKDGVVLTERVDILSGRLLYVDLPVCGTFELRDGKITLWRDYFDIAIATAKLMVSPVRALLRLRG